MFFRKVGRRYLLLHSVREGKAVVQRRLHAFESLEALRQGVEEESWGALHLALSRRCPELRPDWEKLRRRALELLQEDGPPARPARSNRDKLLSACRTLANLVEQERDPSTLREVERELRSLRARLGGACESLAVELTEARRLVEEGQLGQAQRDLTRIARRRKAVLPARRTTVDRSEGPAQPYLQALDLLAEVLARQGKTVAAVRVLEKRLRLCQAPEPRAALGALLQRTGQLARALQQYRRIPLTPVRLMNEAAMHCQRGDQRQALHCILLALARDKRLGRASHAYWRELGDLWDEPARAFFTRVAREPYVRWSVRQAQGKRVRQLIKPFYQELLFERVVATGASGPLQTG